MIGIDNYGLFPLQLSPLATLQWAVKHSAEGVAFSGLNDHDRALCSNDYLRQLREYASESGLYLEWGGAQHIPWDMSLWKKKEIIENNRRSFNEASALGVKVVRSCSGGLMRWYSDSIPTRQLMDDTIHALRTQKQMALDHGIMLALETHFEFTTFELLEIFDGLDARPGEWIGICLDTMNLLTMLEDPVMGTRRVLPWVVSTHIKDGGIVRDGKALKTFTAPVGRGVVDLTVIVSMLKTLPHPIHLNIEDHGGSFDLPIDRDGFLQEFPDITNGEMERLLELAAMAERKLQQKELQMLDRSEWPHVCEARLIEDIIALKRIVHG